MEKIQQSPFLTAFGHFSESERTKQSAEGIKQSIKQLLSKLPDKETVSVVMKNIGMSGQVMDCFKKVIRDKYASVQKLKFILKHLHTIDKEVFKLKNSNRFSKPIIFNKQQFQTLNKCAFDAELQRKNLAKQSDEHTFLLSNQLRLVKAEIERQIFQRKCVNQIGQRSRSQKKNQLMAQKINSVKERNKKWEKICKSVKDKQRLKNEQILKHRKLLSNEDQRKSIKERKKMIPNSKLQADRLFQKNRFTPVDHYRARIRSDKSLQEKRQSGRKTNYMKDLLNKTTRAETSESKLKRYENVLRRQKEREQEEEQKMINKVMKKVMKTPQVSKNKYFEHQQEDEAKDQKQNREPLKKANISMLSKSQSRFEWFQKEEELKGKQNEKIRKKDEMTLMKSELLRQRALKRRDRFQRRKEQIDTLTRIKVDKVIEGEKQFRIKLEMKRKTESKRVQEVIRQKRQQCQFKQILSDQISNLKKCTDQKLQRKLKQMNKNCSEYQQNQQIV